MDYKIREIKEEEYGLLDDFLYEAIFIPEGVEPPPRDIINKKELRIYTENFGRYSADHCLIAEIDGVAEGAVWTRIMNDYGHIDNETPSLAISVHKPFRGQGIGTALMRSILKLLKDKGYKKASLSVQKANYAVKLYEKVGFKVIDDREEEYLMLCFLR